MDYEQRYCAFVDVLGFRELLKELHWPGNRLEMVKKLLQAVHSPVVKTVKRGPIYVDDEVREPDLRAQSISDAVAVSARASTFGLLGIFEAVQRLAVTLLEEGYFVRGAIVRDYLYHDENMVFGDALVSAFNLEQTIAKYPRIVIARDVMQDLEKHVTNVYAGTRAKLDMSFVCKAEDGPYFLHVLRELEGFGRDRAQAVFTDKSAQKISDHLRKKLEDSRYDPSHYEKTRWFCRYWNSMFHTARFAHLKVQGVQKLAEHG